MTLNNYWSKIAHRLLAIIHKHEKITSQNHTRRLAIRMLYTMKIVLSENLLETLLMSRSHLHVNFSHINSYARHSLRFARRKNPVTATYRSRNSDVDPVTATR